MDKDPTDLPWLGDLRPEERAKALVTAMMDEASMEQGLTLRMADDHRRAIQQAIEDAMMHALDRVEYAVRRVLIDNGIPPRPLA